MTIEALAAMPPDEAPQADFTASELLAVMSARLLKDGQTVFAGVGIPLLAAILAQRTHAPGLTILFEGGVIGPFVVPGRLPPSTNEQRCARRANMLVSITEVLLLLQRGYVDVGFMGGAQIDRYGNLNSSFIGDADKPKIRLPGTGGGNDIASLADMIVAMRHEKRRFVEKVDFITSPGFLDGGDSRAASGLPAGGMFRVVTDLGILGFDAGDPRHDGGGAASRRHRRADPGQYRLPAAGAAGCRGDRAADARGARHIARARSRAALHRLSLPPHGEPDDDPGLRRCHAQLHALPGTAGCRRADRLWRADGAAGLRVALGVGPHPARHRPAFPDHRSLSLLTAVAARTTTIKIGTGVLVLPLRNPVILAKQLSSLDLISNGRLMLGAAVGWYKREFDAVGIPFERRGKIMDRNLDITPPALDRGFRRPASGMSSICAMR